MLLTLNAVSMRKRMKGTSKKALSLTDLPQLTLDQLCLRGLIVDTSLLQGWHLDQMDQLRIRADQAGCPCLVLRESHLVAANTTDDKLKTDSLDRLSLVAQAAHRLGCNALAVTVKSFTDDVGLERSASFLREVMKRLDRLELNLLIEPGSGTIAKPEVLIELVKKVGGFRIGTMPNFANAWNSDDCVTTLRQTVPYAGAVLATCGFDAAKSSKSKTKNAKSTTNPDQTEALGQVDIEMLNLCVEAIKSVGYSQILAIDYVGHGAPENIIDAARLTILEAMDEQ